MRVLHFQAAFGLFAYAIMVRRLFAPNFFGNLADKF